MRALICGITGQDGSYLAKHLLEQGYEVIGTSRDKMAASFNNLKQIGIHEKDLEILSMPTQDYHSVYQVLRTRKPDEVYNLSGQTSVQLSFEQPVEAIGSILIGTLNILESLRILNVETRFYNSGSSECFGDTGNHPANEQTALKPRNPYGVAKSSALLLVKNYRESYNIFACTGILFNHESPIRSERFVTQKIVRAASRIAKGSLEKLELGNIDVYRDWGWAPEYITAMPCMIRSAEPKDYVIATGRTVSLEYFVSQSFAFFGLNWTNHVVYNNALKRSSDIRMISGDPQKIKTDLRWETAKDVDFVIQEMCKAASMVS